MQEVELRDAFGATEPDPEVVSIGGFGHHCGFTADGDRSSHVAGDGIDAHNRVAREVGCGAGNGGIKQL